MRAFESFFFCISATAASLILRNSKICFAKLLEKFLLADLPCTHFAQSGFGDSPRAHTEIALLHRHRYSLLFFASEKENFIEFSFHFFPSFDCCLRDDDDSATKKSYTIFRGSNSQPVTSLDLSRISRN